MRDDDDDDDKTYPTKRLRMLHSVVFVGSLVVVCSISLFLRLPFDYPTNSWWLGFNWILQGFPMQTKSRKKEENSSIKTMCKFHTPCFDILSKLWITSNRSFEYEYLHVQRVDATSEESTSEKEDGKHSIGIWSLYLSMIQEKSICQLLCWRQSAMQLRCRLRRYLPHPIEDLRIQIHRGGYLSS